MTRRGEWLVVLGAIGAGVSLPLIAIIGLAYWLPKPAAEPTHLASVAEAQAAQSPRPPTVPVLQPRDARPFASAGPFRTTESDDPLRPHPPLGEGRGQDEAESGLPASVFHGLTRLARRGVDVQRSFRATATQDQMRRVNEVFSREHENAQLAVGRYRLKKLDEQQTLEVIDAADDAFVAEAASILGVEAERLRQESSGPGK